MSYLIACAVQQKDYQIAHDARLILHAVSEFGVDGLSKHELFGQDFFENPGEK